MEESTTLESFQALHADLLALSEQRLLSIERLGLHLNAHIQDFRNFLHKNPRNNESRKKLETGKIVILENEYAINEEFIRGTQELADELDLDEINAARIFLEAQEDTIAPGQTILTNSIVRFHQRRKCLLDCLWLLFQMSADIDLDEALREDLQAIIGQIITTQTGSKRFTQKCLTSMSDIKIWLQSLADKLNGASIIGKLNPETLEAIEYQRVSLIKQHELIGTVLVYLVRENYSNVEDLHLLLGILRNSDKYDSLLVHHLPVLIACILKYGGTDAPAGMADARALHQKFMTGQPTNHETWTLSYVHAAFRVLWLAEYSGWYSEAPDGSILDTQLTEESKLISKLFTEALKEGAFDFILSVSADVKSADWQDPARHGLRQWLQRKSPVLLSDTVAFSDFFQDILMEQLEVFIESFITNLPDVLRKLRVDEDEQRQLSKDHDHDLDLERFIVIISYVFEGRPKAAQEAFWGVPDGALVGFVYWAAHRASTPLVCAFCEMLQSLSEDEECATAAHYFLLDESTQASGKMRRTHSLTWGQVFKELSYFTGRIRDHLAPLQSQNYRGSTNASLLEAEPESVMMLECYLRLITRLCSKSEPVRAFIAMYPTFNLVELLFQLASSAVGPRLRANAFLTARSLLNNKVLTIGEYVWGAIELWQMGNFAPASVMLKSVSSASYLSKGSIMQGLLSGFEEPNAFIQLLEALVSPYNDEAGLNDRLYFPEKMGSKTRQLGIDMYVDFAVGEVFGRQSGELERLDLAQRRMLNLTCLNFITTCLDTFNENLIILGSQIGISIDLAIRASSLQNYILLHPFSRVMEWMFNEKIMNVLFSVVQQDPAEVARAEPDSPLILSLLQGIRLIIMILELEPTYLNIVQPLLETHAADRRSAVWNSSFASFEEGVLNHLGIFPALGRYCGTGHPELIILSLKLLEKLFSSPKLSSVPSYNRRSSGKSKALAALDEDSEMISKILLREMEAEIDINQGPQSSAYIIKLHILEFLVVCLQASPNQPSIAHLLLGFRCGNEGLFIDPNSSFKKGVSLFHTILNAVLSAPTTEETGFSTWLISLHFKALQVLRELWTTPISANIIIPEIRANDFFFLMFVKEQVIQPGMTWDGLHIGDESFLSSTAASCLSNFLSRRAILLQYLSTELLRVSQSHIPSLKQRITETLMGSTGVDDGQVVEHYNIFDMFDFLDFDLNTLPSPPELRWISDNDILACSEILDGCPSTFNVTKLEELLTLKRSELANLGIFENAQDLAIFDNESQELINYCVLDNQIKILASTRRQVLKSWVQLVLIMIEAGNLDDISKTNFILRALQVIIPRLESDLQMFDEAVELAWLAKALIFNLDFKAECFNQSDIGDLVSDRIFQLFQISLRAINTLGTKIYLKEWFYKICFRYLAGMSDLTRGSGLHHRHSIHTIKSAGDKFIDVICDDACNGESVCRISALLVLVCLVKLGIEEKSKYITEALIRLNFVGLLVESLRKIPIELQETPIEELDMQLSYFHAKLALLQQISTTRFGATAVCNGGLFHAIEDSGLFSIDPDLGIDIEGPGAVGKHYDLVVAVVRIMCTTVISRGPQNYQTLHQARRFLTNYRLSILGVLKKSAGLGAVSGICPDTIEDLTELYLLLISFTKFLEHDNLSNNNKSTKSIFSSFT